MGNLSEFESTLDSFNLNWFHNLQKEARRYKTLSEFADGCNWAYACAGLNGWLEHIFSRSNKGGFDPSKPGTFYVLSLEGKYEHYIGFGITNKFKTRLYHHKHNLKKADFYVRVLGTMEFESGRELAEFESYLKKTLPICNTGLEGFKTEAIEPKDYATLRKLCSTILHLPSKVEYHPQYGNDVVNFFRNPQYNLRSYKMQHDLYDTLKRQTVSSISTLGYGKRLYSNRYLALMEVLGGIGTKEPIFLPKAPSNPTEYENRIPVAEELDMVLKNVYDIHSDYEKCIALRDSGALFLRHMILEQDQATLDNVSSGHFFDCAMDKVLQGADGFSPGFFRLHSAAAFDHEKFRQYLEFGGLAKSRARMNRLTPNKHK